MKICSICLHFIHIPLRGLQKVENLKEFDTVILLSQHSPGPPQKIKIKIASLGLYNIYSTDTFVLKHIQM